MITIPLEQPDGSCVIFIIFDDKNIERIKAYDPAELTISKMGKPWSDMKIKEVVLMYGTPAELQAIEQTQTGTEVREWIKRLYRGWKYRPEEGDNDEPYVGQIKKGQNEREQRDH